MAALSWGTSVATVHHNDWGGRNVAVDTSKGNSAMDYAEHNRTYAGFLQFTKYTIIFLVLLLAGMKFFLV
jgi:hypothetical protein